MAAAQHLLSALHICPAETRSRLRVAGATQRWGERKVGDGVGIRLSNLNSVRESAWGLRGRSFHRGSGILGWQFRPRRSHLVRQCKTRAISCLVVHTCDIYDAPSEKRRQPWAPPGNTSPWRPTLRPNGTRGALAPRCGRAKYCKTLIFDRRQVANSGVAMTYALLDDRCVTSALAKSCQGRCTMRGVLRWCWLGYSIEQARCRFWRAS